jgi:hypothetical protein
MNITIGNGRSFPKMASMCQSKIYFIITQMERDIRNKAYI